MQIAQGEPGDLVGFGFSRLSPMAGRAGGFVLACVGLALSSARACAIADRCKSVVYAVGHGLRGVPSAGFRIRNTGSGFMNNTSIFRALKNI